MKNISSFYLNFTFNSRYDMISLIFKTIKYEEIDTKDNIE